MTHCDPYPAYSRAETIADGVVHAIGLAAATIMSVLLLIWAMGTGDGGRIVGVSVYAAALVFSLLASALYHMTPWGRTLPIFRRIDHAAIYFKIAGTYTPLMVLIGSAFAYGILTLVWVLAAAGAVAKLLFWARPGKWAPILYLVLGWLSLAVIWKLVPILPVAALVLILVGGLLYTLGVVFFSWKGLRYQNAIWHLFVLAASSCFFAAIAMGTLSVT
ncbi:MAG: hemolysin III [Rhodobacteraceae bacterium HLUCCA08]|nr:MAG: hemolysin III [Rhodobacteraceae bacterium HLUCCA08]